MLKTGAATGEQQADRYPAKCTRCSSADGISSNAMAVLPIAFNKPTCAYVRPRLDANTGNSPNCKATRPSCIAWAIDTAANGLCCFSILTRQCLILQAGRRQKQYFLFNCRVLCVVEGQLIKFCEQVFETPPDGDGK